MATDSRKNRVLKKKRRRRLIAWKKEQFRRRVRELAQEKIRNILRQHALEDRSDTNYVTYDPENDYFIYHQPRHINYIEVSFILKPAQIPNVIQEDLESVLFD